MNKDLFKVELINVPIKDSDPPIPKLIVRIVTSSYYDNNGIHIKKTIRFLKRKSINRDGHLIYEDLSNVGADEVVKTFINLDGIKDGLYEIEICNPSYAYEDGYNLGYIDSWNYKLVEYKE